MQRRKYKRDAGMQGVGIIQVIKDREALSERERDRQRVEREIIGERARKNELS